MKLYIQFSLLIAIGLFPYTIMAQLTCDFIPLEFEDITPQWRHAVIDTSIIDYVYPDAVHNGGNGDVFYNGMNHFEVDRGSFVKDGYLYSITGINFDLDIVGYSIEKIDLLTGEVLWKVIADPRTESYSMKILEVEVESNKLIIKGVRPIVEDDFALGLKVGRVNSYLFEREYDLESGELLSSFTPNNEEENLYAYKSEKSVDYIIYGESSSYHYRLLINPVNGLHITRSETEVSGKKIAETDTVIVGQYNELYEQTLVSSKSLWSKLMQGPDNTLLYLEEFVPKPQSDQDQKARLVKYDFDLNVISTFDLTELEVDFKALYIYRFTEDRIILKGCADHYPDCNNIYIILDSDYNFIKQVRSEYNEEEVSAIYQVEYFDENDNVFISEHVLDEKSHFTLYASNQEGGLDSIRRLYIKEDNWASAIDFNLRLDNGDWLFKFRHGCHSDNVFRNRYSEWIRFDKDDFNLMTSTNSLIVVQNHLTISPNPAHDYINLDLGDRTDSGMIAVYDISGRLMTEIDDVTTAIDIDVSEWSRGTYIIQHIGVDGSSVRDKFVKI